MSIEEKEHLEKLVKEAKDGNINSKEEILNIFKKSIFYITKKYFIRNYEREDLISEGYKALLIAINKYNVNKNCFYTYGYRAIENRCIDLLRKEKDLEGRESLNITDEIGDFLKSEEISVEDRAYHNFVRGQINTLPEEEREVIKKIYLGGQTISQVAKEKGLTFSRVQYVRNRALTTLKTIV